MCWVFGLTHKLHVDKMPSAKTTPLQNHEDTPFDGSGAPESWSAPHLICTLRVPDALNANTRSKVLEELQIKCAARFLYYIFTERGVWRKMNLFQNNLLDTKSLIIFKSDHGFCGMVHALSPIYSCRCSNAAPRELIVGWFWFVACGSGVDQICWAFSN